MPLERVVLLTAHPAMTSPAAVTEVPLSSPPESFSCVSSSKVRVPTAAASRASWADQRPPPTAPRPTATTNEIDLELLMILSALPLSSTKSLCAGAYFEAGLTITRTLLVPSA